ncbi:hypothetical protein V1517DRAFT_325185 [Lipomyces orientalis]|uniref:Uncharacterized protein n=1 Tax=Lipomyces orientalis TaxID=1233043 RepID=A0ACC3TL52_9ASCO
MKRIAIPFRRLLPLLLALAIVTFVIVGLLYTNLIDEYSEYIPFGRSVQASSSTSSETALTDEQIRLSVIQQYEFNKKIVASGSPLNAFATCDNPLHTNESAVVLVSQNGPEGTLARIEFTWFGFNTPARYNPNVLPYPPGGVAPYFGLARQTVELGEKKHHELVYCDMEWGLSKGIGRRILTCKGGLRTLEVPEWRSPRGTCVWLPYLEDTNGPSDPRVFFSPKGEPLMIVGTNGITNCLSQYIIDLRMMIPDLGKKMKVEHVPVRFKQLTELPRDHYGEVEKNWFLLYDEKDIDYVQHDIENRSISAVPTVDTITSAHAVNFVQGETVPPCISSLKKEYKEKDDQIRNDIHQGTNTLRVTLCEFPCIPTIHNTVLIEMFHIKYHSYLEVFYRRYVMLMNVTAPFEVIGRTNNLIYAGSDEKMMIYTVSMAWDHTNFRRHEPWSEGKYGGRAIWNAIEDQEAEEYENSINDFNGDAVASRRRDEPDKSDSSTSALVDKAEQDSSAPVSTEEEAAARYPFLENVALRQNSTYTNPLVNEYYHGWIDDTIILNIGINDLESGIVHVKASDLLECVTVCK